MTKVYIWPSNLGGSTLYGDPNIVRVTAQWSGAPGQKTEMQQRATFEVSGEVVRHNAADFDIMMDRLRGGVNLLAVWDIEWRLQNGWDAEIALNSTAAEFWRKDGRTSLYNSESANPPTGPWRSVFALANGAASVGATSLPIDGLLASETIPKGAMIRVGDYRYRTLSSVTANASGEATLALASTLRAAVSNDAQVRVPGDFFVGSLLGRPEVSASDADGVRTFTIRLAEVYEDELADTSVSPTELFEYVVD